jgi:hypothetical protein
MLKSVPPAPVTSLNIALSTLENVWRQFMTALFTLMWAPNVLPRLMVTIVPVSEVLDHRSDSRGLLWRIDSNRLTCNDLICTCNQSVFVPLCTGAGLPPFATNVAELGTAMASLKVSSRFLGLKGYQRNMIAADLQFDQTTTIIATLPPMLFGGIESLL